MDNNYTEHTENTAFENSVAPETTEELDDAAVEPEKTEETEPPAPDNSLPLEEITFIPTFEERLEQRRHLLKPLMWILYVFAALCFVIGIHDYIETKVFSAQFIVSAVLILLALASRSGAKTNVKEEMKKDGTPTYRVFYNRIEYECRIGEDLYTFYRIDPKKITKVKSLRHIIVFIHEGILFMIPKSAVTNNSYLLRAINVKSNSSNGHACDAKVRDKRQTAIIWLLSCSAVIFAATIIVSYLAPVAAIVFAILSFLSVGLPIVSLALIAGWKSRGKGLIIAASIILIFALLCSFGFGMDAYDKSYMDDDARLANNILDSASEISGVDFPDVYSVYSDEYELYDQESKAYFSYNMLTCTLSDEDNEYLKSEVEGSHVWITKMTEDMQAFVGDIYTPYNDPFVIVNLTEGTCNQLPTVNAECKYAIIVYDHSFSDIYIYVFSKEYTGSSVSSPDALAA